MNEQLNKNSDVMLLTDTTFKINDTLDESRNREQNGLSTELGKESVEVNMLTETVNTEIDSSDESKNRFETIVTETDCAKRKTVVADLHIQADSDSSDSSQNRTFRSTLTMNLTPRPLRAEVDVTDMAAQDHKITKKSWRETMSDVSKSSTSRNDRCSMSYQQQAEQLATPVMQGGCIDTTVVNKHDVDGCCVTNKCNCFEQDSRQMSNQWLSNTFSMITSGILGKSKTAAGKDSKENVDANSNTKLVFKPEFNFFL